MTIPPPCRRFDSVAPPSRKLWLLTKGKHINHIVDFMDFLDKYTSCGQTGKKTAIRKKDKEWRINENAETLIDGICIHESSIGKYTMKILNTLNLNDVIPAIGKVIRIRVQSQLNMISIVMALAQKNHCSKCVIATYTLNKEALDILCAMVKSGSMKNLQILMASSLGFRAPEQKTLMISRSKSVGFKLAFVYSHLKILLMQCGDNFYQVEGAMNFSTNNSAENIIVSNDEGIYKYDLDFLTNTMLSRNNKATQIIR